MAFFQKENLKKLRTQLFAIVEKEIHLKLRFKFSAVQEMISPLIVLLLPLFIMGFIFGAIINVGYWNEGNYSLFLLLGYMVTLLRGAIGQMPSSFLIEKGWRTLPSLMVAPIHRFTLLFGIFISKLIIASIPIITIFVICLIVYPISVMTFFSILGVFFLISLILFGIGVIISVFSISKESIWNFLEFSFSLIFTLSALNIPIEIFPGIVQSIIKLNPLFHYFDFLRLAWIENDIIFSIFTHNFQFLLLLASAIFLPIIGIILFDKFYRKYGIEG